MLTNHLTRLENFSYTAEVAKQLASLNHFKYAIVGTPSSRIIGVVAIPLASLADAFLHASLAAGKIVMGVIISPYNTFAVLLFPTKAAPNDLEFSSALIHLMRVVDSLFAGVTLPFICLLNPDRAYQYMSHRLEAQKSVNEEIAVHRQEFQQEIPDKIGKQNPSMSVDDRAKAVIAELAEKIAQLELDVQNKENAQNALQTENQQLKNKIHQLEGRPLPGNSPTSSPKTTTETTTPPPFKGAPPPPPPPMPENWTKKPQKQEKKVEKQQQPVPQQVEEQKKPDASALWLQVANMVKKVDDVNSKVDSPQVVPTPRSEEAKIFDSSKLLPVHQKVLDDAVKLGAPALSNLKQLLNDEIIDKLEDFDDDANAEALEHEMVKKLTDNILGLDNDRVLDYFKGLEKKVVEANRKLAENNKPPVVQQPEVVAPVQSEPQRKLEAKKQELLKQLEIKAGGHNIKQAHEELSIFKKGRFTTFVTAANNGINTLKDKFQSVEDYLQKYTDLVNAIESMKDVTDYNQTLFGHICSLTSEFNKLV